MTTITLKYVCLLLLNKLTEKTTIVGLIALATTVIHYNLDPATADLLSTIVASITSLVLIWMRERSKVIVAPVVVATPDQVADLTDQTKP